MEPLVFLVNGVLVGSSGLTKGVVRVDSKGYPVWPLG